MKQCIPCLVLLGSLFAAGTGVTGAAQPNRKDLEFFELKIRPVLIKKCASCHSDHDDAESALPVNSRSALLAGGDFGPAFIPGKPQQSLLIQVIQRTHKELRMPPDEEDKLSAATIADFKRWIKLGAPWPKEQVKSAPRTIRSSPKQMTTSHWSYLPRQDPKAPTVNDPKWMRSPIDRFVFRKHQEQHLTPVDLASRRVLIRRATFDLTGLPPTPKEVDNFINDPAPDRESFTTVVDRLLASPTYGERWGRHWLDVARYADTQGDTGDFPIPGAYMYRNWVINALNADMPYDRFLYAQLAGDLLAQREADPKLARDLRIATGFIALSRRFGNSRFKSQHLMIENTIDTLGSGIMGVTLRCARCHDHKFDPMLATDYYGLYGIFESTRYPSMGASDDKSPINLVAASGDAGKQHELDEYWELVARYQYQIRNHFRLWLKPTLDEYRQLTADIKVAKEKNQPTETLEARQQELLSIRGGRFRELMEHGLEWLKQEKRRLINDPMPDEMLYAVMDGVPHHSRLHRRGDIENLGEEVPRHFLSVISDPEHKVALRGSGREELAAWLTAPEHPLTARVIVNRIWHHHFGRGIVKTVDNLGVQGEAPSHPQLLDFLANQLIANGWSLKSMHRLIMLSRVYRLASTAGDANLERDPSNTYLWKYARRRLDAEAIRDAMLAVSGQLDSSQGTAHPFPSWDQNRSSLNSPFHVAYPSRRRSVYLMTQRLFKHPFLGLFDGPDTNQTSGSRASSTVASQALYLMNSPDISEQAEAWGARLRKSESAPEKRVVLAYQLAFGREPTDVETEETLQHIAAYQNQVLSKENDPQKAEELAWNSLALILLTSNEFFFID